MSKGLLFWMLMILMLIFGAVMYWPMLSNGRPWGIGYPILGWVVVALLGWQVFGGAVK